MPRVSENIDTIAAKLEQVCDDPAVSVEQLRFWLLMAASVLRDVAVMMPGNLEYGLAKIDPEGTA